jgi:hypothetical protein
LRKHIWILFERLYVVSQFVIFCSPSLLLLGHILKYLGNSKLEADYHLLTPWSRVFLEKLTGLAANQKIPRILWSPKVHYRTHRRPPPVPVLSQLTLSLQKIMCFSFNPSKRMLQFCLFPFCSPPSISHFISYIYLDFFNCDYTHTTYSILETACFWNMVLFCVMTMEKSLNEYKSQYLCETIVRNLYDLPFHFIGIPNISFHSMYFISWSRIVNL